MTSPRLMPVVSQEHGHIDVSALDLVESRWPRASGTPVPAVHPRRAGLLRWVPAHGSSSTALLRAADEQIMCLRMVLADATPVRAGALCQLAIMVCTCTW